MALHKHLLVPGSDPAPQRDRVALTALFFGVMAAPLAWMAQLVVNYAVASHSCFPHDFPLVTGATVDGTRITTVIVNLAAIALALAAVAVSLRAWRSTEHEQPGDSEQAIALGEGRTRFMALWGQITGAVFLLAILFDTLALILVPECLG